jgi:Ca2+/Na+ antiporter
VDSAYECLEDRFFHIQSVKDEYYQANLIKELEKEQIQHEKEMSWWIGCVIILFLSLIAAFIIYNVWKNKQHLVAEHEKEMQHQQELLHQKSKTHAVLQKHFMEKLAYSRKLMADDERAHMGEEDWKEMEHLIDDTDNNFVQKLRQQYKGLKEEDVRLCMLVRLKMTNAIIANVFYIGESAVKKRKSVLKKTGFQITDPNISLEQVIENL